MRLRMAAAAVLIAAGVFLGATGMASAAAPVKPQACSVALNRVPVLLGRQAKLNAQLASVANGLSKAEAHGRTAIVNRLVARSTSLRLALDKVGTTIDKIHERCD